MQNTAESFFFASQKKFKVYRCRSYFLKVRTMPPTQCAQHNSGQGKDDPTSTSHIPICTLAFKNTTAVLCSRRGESANKTFLLHPGMKWVLHFRQHATFTAVQEIKYSHSCSHRWQIEDRGLLINYPASVNCLPWWLLLRKGDTNGRRAA